MTKQTLTQNGYNDLLKELEQLDVQKVETAKRMNLAAANGDLSENSNYTTAKSDLNNIKIRIDEVKRIIKYSNIVKDNKNRSICEVGATVLLEMDGKETTYILVSPVESNPLESKLSVESLIGKSLLGHKSKDEIKVITPNGERIVLIKGVK